MKKLVMLFLSTFMVMLSLNTILVSAEENELVKKRNGILRSTGAYDVRLEPVSTQYKWTGYRLAGGQPVNGTRFGRYGGGFGYVDDDSNSRVSLSFGISGYRFIIGVGVGNVRTNIANVVNAPSNTLCKLYVNKQVRVITYRRYKVYRVNGYREPYGYTHSPAEITALSYRIY